MDMNFWHMSGTLRGVETRTGRSGSPYVVMTLGVVVFSHGEETSSPVELTLFRDLGDLAATFQPGDTIHASGSFSFWDGGNGRTYTNMQVKDVFRLRTARQGTREQAAQALQTPQQGFTVPAPAAPQYQQPPAPAAMRYGQPVTEQEMQELF